MKYKKNRVVPHDLVEARRKAVAAEIFTPPFPEDVEHLWDGSWSCSSASFDKMAQSFRRFGFTLERSWSFDTLYDRFTFILEAACSLRGAGEWPQPDCTPVMIEYLLAVKARDDSRIPAALAAVLAEEGMVDATEAPPPETPAAQPAPKLRLVKTQG